MSLFCLVHGAWHDETCWQPLVEILEARGHICLTPRLPLEDHAADFLDYAEVGVTSLPENPPAVLVGHSRSSSVIPLVLGRRPVEQLIYLCPAMAGFEELADEPEFKRDGYAGGVLDADLVSRWPPERARAELYGRLEPEFARRPAGTLRGQPQAPFGASYPLRRPPDIRAALLYAREDEIFDDRWSRWISRELLGIEPVDLAGGHFPMLEHPALLADALERCVASS